MDLQITEYNPKLDRQPSKSRKSFNFARLKNPIPQEIVDVSDIKKFFSRWPFIPFAGDKLNSADSLLAWLISMEKLSPTLGACIKSIKTYGFGGKLIIVKNIDPDFDLGEDDEEIPDDLKMSYYEFLKTIKLGSETWMTLVRKMYDNYKPSGNYYLEVQLSETLGEKSSAIYLHDTEYCRYWATDKDEDRVIGISPVWTEAYLQDNPPNLIPVYPAFVEDKGIKKTMIHIKHGKNYWYGYPDWMPAFMNCYREFQDNMYLIVEADNGFTGRVFIEVEDDDPEFGDPLDEEGAIEAGFESVADRIEENFTHKGADPMSVMVVSRPYGAKEAFVYQFKPNTNENFYKVTSEINEKKIIRINEWSHRLLGDSVGNGFSDDVFFSELTTKEMGVLGDVREIIGSGINQALNIICEHFSKDEFKELSIWFKSSFEKGMDAKEDSEELEEEIKTEGDELNN